MVSYSFEGTRFTIEGGKCLRVAGKVELLQQRHVKDCLNTTAYKY